MQCGVYVTNTSTYIQQIPLGGTYTSLTAGTFSWLVDMPAGLSVNVQFCTFGAASLLMWVTLNGAVQQFTLPPIIIQPSLDNSCLGTGQGQNTQSIISYASALNESYTWAPCVLLPSLSIASRLIRTVTYSPSATPTSSGSSTNVGAIAGGVIGGVAALLALLLLLYVLHRRRARPPPPPEGKKEAYNPAAGGPTYAQLVAMNYAGQHGANGQGVVPYSPALQQPRPFAAEPMPATPPPSSPSHGHGRAPLSPPATTAGTASEFGGTHGLDDPATFLSRSTASERGAGAGRAV
ncbi:hypothetical protein JCM10450v2_004530 [Rhodotorula kratochvilovae]